MCTALLAVRVISSQTSVPDIRALVEPSNRKSMPVALSKERVAPDVAVIEASSKRSDPPTLARVEAATCSEPMSAFANWSLLWVESAAFNASQTNVPCTRAPEERTMSSEEAEKVSCTRMRAWVEAQSVSSCGMLTRTVARGMRFERDSPSE